MAELPPKVEMVFLKGYLQCLEDFSEQMSDRACKIEMKLSRLQAVIADAEQQTGADARS